MKHTRLTALAAGSAAAAALLATGLAPASAAPLTYDTTFTPGSTDIVGVGSDTIEIVVKNLADGFNADKSSGRIATFQAGTSADQITLRAGAATITRPNGSGAGKALLYGASNNADVDFARSSSTLSTAEIGGGLQQAPFAVDGLKLATATTTNAPATLTAAQVLGIYTGSITNWSQVGGKDGVIKPLIPQSGSGTRSFFLSQLQTQNGLGSAPTLAGTVTDTQEHSPADIQNDPNAIAPFSTARAASISTIKLEDGFHAERAVYDVVRATDLNGARGPLLKAAFGADGYFCSAAGRAIIEAAGFKQLAAGTCGVFGTSAPTSLDTSDQTAANTTTTLTATSKGQAVTLAATVTPSKAVGVSGKVTFYEGSTVVGSTGATGSGATTTNKVLSGVALGAHTYTAVFSPSLSSLNGSKSAAASVTVTRFYASKTSLKVSKKKAVVKVALVGATAKATGKVALYNGKKKLKTVTLKKGAATITLPKKKGTYKLKAKYLGSKTSDVSVSKVVKYKVK